MDRAEAQRLFRALRLPAATSSASVRSGGTRRVALGVGLRGGPAPLNHRPVVPVHRLVAGRKTRLSAAHPPSTARKTRSQSGVTLPRVLSRKPLWALRFTEGSNPSPSATGANLGDLLALCQPGDRSPACALSSTRVSEGARSDDPGAVGVSAGAPTPSPIRRPRNPSSSRSSPRARARARFVARDPRLDPVSRGLVSPVEELLEDASDGLRVGYVSLAFDGSSFGLGDARRDRVSGWVEGCHPAWASGWVGAGGHQRWPVDLGEAGPGRLAISQAGRVICERVFEGLGLGPHR
jgi:hypothetical protein